jgi:hypothetical protein
MSNPIDDYLFKYSKLMEEPSVEKDTTCSDCGDAISGVEVHLYQYKMYCTECVNEIRQTCESCSKQEKELYEFETYNAEDAGKMKPRVLCYDCVRKLCICSRHECRTIILAGEDTKCPDCPAQVCSSHLHTHECIVSKPYKNYATKKQHGDITKASSIKSKRLVGFEIEAVGGKFGKITSMDDRLGMAYDSSIKGENPLEVISPPASADILERLIDNATKTIRKAKYEINTSCGLHIHIDSADFRASAQKIFQVISTYYALEPLIYKTLPKSRRSNRYAIPLRYWIDEAKMMEISRIKNLSLPVLESHWYKSRDDSYVHKAKGRKYDSSRYHGVNLHSLFKDGHLELRHHQGTLNAKKIKNWIRWNLLIVDWAINHYNKDVAESLYFNSDIQSKLRIMTKRMGLPKDLRRHIVSRLEKFKNIKDDDLD